MAAPLGALLALLGSQTAGQSTELDPRNPLTGLVDTIPDQTVPPAGTTNVIPPEGQGEDIVVSKPADTSLPDAMIAPSAPPAAPVDNSIMPMTQASQQMQATQQPLEGLQEHKGMFGLKGTLRDILGTLGDAFLVGTGKDAVYRPGREQEKFSDMAVGFNNANPQIRNQAIQRMMAVNPGLAQKFLEQEQQNQYRTGQNDIAMAKAKSQEGTDAQKAFKDGSAIYGQALRGMLSSGRYNKAYLDAIANRYGLGDEYEAPDQLDQDWAAGRISAATTVNQQENVQLGNRRQDEIERHNPVAEATAKQNAASNAIRANRPAAGRAAPQPTKASLAAAAMAKDPKTRTEDEQALVDDFVSRNKKKSAAQAIIEKLGGEAPKTSTIKSGQIVTQNGRRFQKQVDGSFKPLKN